MLIVFFLAGATVLILPIIGLMSNNNPTVKDITAKPAGVLAGFFFPLVAIYVNMLTPDIRLRNDAFQLRTVFYHSQWLKWEDIQFIKVHFLSMKRYKMHGVRIDHISPIYSLIGFTQQMGGKTFLITEKIQDYDHLMQVLEINRPNQVWSTDITYVPMPQGFMYLVAIMDWFSRFVVAWQVSNTLDGDFCLTTLRSQNLNPRLLSRQPSRKQRVGEIPREANAEGNASDMLTRGR